MHFFLKINWTIVERDEIKKVSVLGNSFSLLLILLILTNFMQMDGFVLPPYESTTILKDKDLIRLVYLYNPLQKKLKLVAL